MKLSWNQPICLLCWVEKNGDRMPVQVTECEARVCAYCGYMTDRGICVRDNAENVEHPSWDED